MSLIALRKANAEIASKHIQQLVKIAGDGVLKDGATASLELREFLADVPTDVLRRYLSQCLETSFEDSGLVLQDVVNELGERLGCSVERGLYRGKQHSIGFDGIWKFPDGYSVVVEVKTTDAYTVSLDKLAGYRKALVGSGKITDRSSILIVVGRKDTDSLEAQVRGSRHGWDIRLISADKLLRLVEIKEAADSKETIQKIRTVLTPLELTKVDFIVELLATTAEDITQAPEDEPDTDVETNTTKPEKRFTPVAFHAEVVESVERALGISLKKETRSLYATADKGISVRTLVSKSHPHGSASQGYWYAFHPYYRDALDEYGRSFVAFGCGGPQKVLMFDLGDFAKLLPKMNTTEKEDRTYWHVHFIENPQGRVELRLKGGEPPLDVTSKII
jgi:hypothetical protein